ncbi:hypothetical protein FDECE_3889 [Fusarium decemcellulare]|nr:hypothetical protein FDECE_3889 [Fusarium decemcellulare]
MSPESSSDKPVAERPAARSCFACNSKKIRCDKAKPCSSCMRSGKTCAYPPVGPRVRRTKKTLMADLATRISSLEKTLVKATAAASTDVEAVVPELSRIQIQSESIGERSGDDVLVRKGSSSQYFNEILVSRMIGEEQNIESALTTPRVDHFDPNPSPFNAMGILSAPSLSQSPSDFHPEKHTAIRLWNTYVNDVECCLGLKISHVPTDEVKVYSTIHDPAKANFEDLAFCLAIYFAATVALEEQVSSEFDKKTLLLRFKFGLEQAFAHGEFLEKPTVTGLRALAIYLSALRVHNRGKGIWILNGLAIRMAQSLGLHRDGQLLKLPPFETEIRRRLWWHLVTRDSRSGEDYGLENSTLIPPMSEVEPPLNVDDADLYPLMKALPAERPGWTAMTFSLINIDLAKTMQRLTNTMASSSSPSEQTRSKIIEEARSQLSKRVERCNPVVPQQRLSLYCARFLLRKLDFFTKQQWLLLQHRGSREKLATEENLLEALEIVEGRLFGEDALLAQYSWALKAYPQYHVTMYILWHLCIRPEGPHVGRAWKAVDAVFSRELTNEFVDGVGSKLVVLTALRSKAESVRVNSQKKIEEARSCESVQDEYEDRSANDALSSLDGVNFDELMFDINGDWAPWTFQPDRLAYPMSF